MKIDNIEIEDTLFDDIISKEDVVIFVLYKAMGMEVVVSKGSGFAAVRRHNTIIYPSQWEEINKLVSFYSKQG
jgi:hypothetical protein